MIDTEFFYLKVVFDDLPIYDEEGKIIPKEILSNYLYTSSYNCLEFGLTNEYFIDLVSNYSNPYNYHTYVKYSHLKFHKTNESQTTGIYASRINDETGEFIEDKTLFFFDSKSLNELETINIKPNKANALDKINGNWLIKSIDNKGGGAIGIDYCLKKYHLKISPEQKFSQGYYSANKCGLIDLNKSSYKHSLSYQKGFWKIFGNDLIFVDTDFKRIQKWEFKFINNDTLQLTRNKNYTITLTKIKN